MNSVPSVIWEGAFTLFGVEVHCCVLDNGERVIEASSFQRLMEAMATGAATSPDELHAFAKWQQGASL